MTKLFIVIVDDEASRAKAYERIKAGFDTAYWYRDSAILVASERAVSKDVAETAGIGDDGLTGFVFRLGDGYTGYTARSLWEWLKDQGDE